MRLLTDTGSLLVYGGRSGWFLLGVGLILIGLAFGALPLVAYLRGGETSLLAVAAMGSLLLLVGLWGVTVVHRIEIDRTERRLRVLQGSRFLASPESISFDRVRELGVVRRTAHSGTPGASGSPGVSTLYHVLVVRLDDGREIEIDDEEIDHDLERVRSRGRRIARLVGVPFVAELEEDDAPTP